MSDAPDHMTARYIKQKGEGIVYGGIFIAAALILFGIARAPVLVLAAAAAALGVALYHWPFVAQDRRAFVISPAGITLDRLGLIPWNAISDAEIVDRYVRTIRNADLQLTLRRPLDTAVENAAVVGLFRRYMYRCWRTIDAQQIAIRLSTLDVKPELVEAAVREHLQRPL
ncbi:MAG: hypothetical protein RLO15_04765 [Parvibaculum sp.]